MSDKEYKSFWSKAGGQEGKTCRYSLRLDTYGCGCSHNCQYCYVRSLLSFRKIWNPNEPKVADIHKIEEKIKRLGKNSIVRLGGMTDCFQDCEKTRKVTLETIRILNDYGIIYLIVTKSDLIATDEYMKILDKNLAHIQISVTSTKDSVSKQIENAPLPSRRIAAIEKLSGEGFDVQVRLSPYISGFLDMDRVNLIKCDKIIVESLRANYWIKKWLQIDFSQYSHYENNYNHLPLPIKIELLSHITGFRDVSVCEDCQGHFEYWRNHVNPNFYDCCNLRI